MLSSFVNVPAVTTTGSTFPNIPEKPVRVRRGRDSRPNEAALTPPSKTTMNRVINNPDLVVDDMLRGILAASHDLEALVDNPRVLKRTCAPLAGKVGIVAGGASGHEPAFVGYLGESLLDAVAVGEIFSSPTAMSFFDAIRVADSGHGVACLFGNYAGDNMNVSMARKMAKRAGVQVKTIAANDDLSSAPKGEESKRRGTAGQILMWKTAAACAASGGTLDEVITVAQKTIDRTRSITIGLSACVIPAVGKANFEIEDGTMAIGIGHQGEPGIRTGSTVSADEMAKIMVDAILTDMPMPAGSRIAIQVSGMGATPLMENYIFFASVAKNLEQAGITVVDSWVGNYFTSLEMMGVTLSLLHLDKELETLVKHPCASLALTRTAEKI